MEPDFQPFDLYRMFVGEQPLLFYAEVLVRTLIIYFYTLLMIRWIGGRGLAQLSMVEFVLVIALGSAVGDSMFYPDIPLLIAMVVITAVIGMNKFLDIWIQRSDLVKSVIEGQPLELVRHGRLLQEGLDSAKMSGTEVKGLLRLERIRNLGQVEHAYLESNGRLSVFEFDTGRPGLSLVPPKSVSGETRQAGLPEAPPDAYTGIMACGECGYVVDAETTSADTTCKYCHKIQWVDAERADVG